MEDDILIYDIETATNGKPDATKDIFKVFGCYSYKTKKYYILTKLDQVQRMIDGHKFLVGFNNAGNKYNPGYDNTVLERHGISFKYKKLIDLRSIFKQRASQMKIKKGMLGDLIMIYSLDYITRLLDLVDDSTAKGELDYSILRKESWTKEEMIQIKQYTIRDIEITKKLYEWVEDYFKGFKEYINEKDVENKVYLTSSLPGVAYKAICKELNWSETHGQVYEDEKIGGGYVSYPAGEKFEGDIYCLDYNSLYPHIMIQCNLYGRKTMGFEGDERPIWNGQDKWKVEGVYYSDKLDPVGELLKCWYILRLFYKRSIIINEDHIAVKINKLKDYIGKTIPVIDTSTGKLKLVDKKIDDKLCEEYLELYNKGVDSKEYSLKIFINIVYGILNNMYYDKVYDRIGGGDCTRLGRQWTKYARILYKRNGYLVIYTDTDSVYVLDHLNDREKLLGVRDQIIKDIKSSVPFPQDTFDMGIDDEIKYMYFFKGKQQEDKESDKEMDEDDFVNKPKGFMKKNYIYVTKDDRVIIKNLGLKKKDRSALSKKIFWEHLVPKIKQGQIKFGRTMIKSLIKELLEKDITLAAMRRDVGNFEQYNSKTCMGAQIAQCYGPGIHFLIPNTKGIGAGKGKKFCTIEEFKKHNMTIDHIDLDNVWKELDYFIKPVVTKNIFDFE